MGPLNLSCPSQPRLCPNSTAQATAFYSAQERQLLTRLLARDQAEPEAPETVRLCASWGITSSSLAKALRDLNADCMD